MEKLIQVKVKAGLDSYDGLEVYDLQDNLVDRYPYSNDPDETDIDILKRISKDYAIIEYWNGINTYEDIDDIVSLPLSN